MQVKKVSYHSSTAAEEFVESILNTGFAVVTDHPISHNLINTVFAEWERFFKSEEKHNCMFSPETQTGYFPFRSENAKGSSHKDLKEFYHYYRTSQLPAGMSNSTEQLFDNMAGLASTLLGWINDVTPENVQKLFSMPLPHMIEGSKSILLRPIHYPPLLSTEDEGATRAAAHEDINLITLLPAATEPGLEVLDLQGKWHSVECDPCNIVVNSGDMLRMASGGYYPSTTHRVVNPSGESARKSRFSMPLFLHPRGEVRLSEVHTAHSYLEERLREIGLLKQGEAKEVHENRQS